MKCYLDYLQQNLLNVNIMKPRFIEKFHLSVKCCKIWNNIDTTALFQNCIQSSTFKIGVMGADHWIYYLSISWRERSKRHGPTEEKWSQKGKTLGQRTSHEKIKSHTKLETFCSFSLNFRPASKCSLFVCFLMCQHLYFQWAGSRMLWND